MQKGDIYMEDMGRFMEAKGGGIEDMNAFV